jgi:hypothetical protein
MSEHLTIESPEELRVAREAVKKFRATQVRHVGRHAKRMEYPCHSSDRERAFANGWAKQNKRVSWLSGGLGTLERLLCIDQVQSEYEPDRTIEKFTRELTPAEAVAAATALQWLGTNCGWCFLEQCVNACGYRLVPDKSKG